MQKKFSLMFFLFFLSIPLLHSWNFVNKEAGEIFFLEACQEENLEICENIFINAFTKAYENFTPAQLGVVDKETFLKEAFADVYDDVRKGVQHLMVAKKGNLIVGFVGFKKTEKPKQIYISQLAVDPQYWQKGIGRHLVFSVFHVFNDVDRLVVIPRRINEIARNFYQKLGFFESSYMHPGYDPKKYIGYEWVNPSQSLSN